MTCDSSVMRVVCWLSAVMMLSLSLGEMCFAQTVKGFDDPDSVATEPEAPAIYKTINPVQSISPDSSLVPNRVGAPDDSLVADGEGGPQPVYKKWWVYAAAAVTLGVIIALAGGSSSTGADKDLPGFPDPPER